MGWHVQKVLQVLREKCSAKYEYIAVEFFIDKTHFPQNRNRSEPSEPSSFHYFSGSGSSVSFPSFPLRKSRRTTISARS